MKRMFKVSGLVLFILLLFIIPIIVFSISFFQNKSTEENLINIKKENLFQKEIKKESLLSEIVEENFKNDKDYAVVIKNFKTNEEYHFNENKKFISASLYKLWVMAVVMEKIKDGDLTGDQVISGSLTKFDEVLSTDPPTPTLENPTEEEEKNEEEEKFISMKVNDATEKMITVSDNYAALLLSQEVGAKSIDNFLKEYGFENSSYASPPKTTALDIAHFFEKLYKGEMVDEDYSKEMIDILKRQTFNDRIPKYLPERIRVAHKTGELFASKHDAGIVYGVNGDYLIVVLTETNNSTIAAEKIAKFSEDIYNYFEESN